MEKYISIPDGFVLVYQGGHHDVYCNKVDHIRVRGGKCHKKIDRRKALQTARFNCNCIKFKEQLWQTS